MKTTRRILAVLLALAMLCSLGITAFAAEATATLTGSITLEPSETVSLNGKTFNAYKVLNATFVNGTDPEAGVAYTVPAELADWYAERYQLNKEAANFGEQVALAISGREDDHYQFAADVLAAAKKSGKPTGSVAVTHDSKSAVIDNLPFGYYVVEDVGDAKPISALMLDTVGGVTAKIKADKPSIEKKIDGDKDTDPSTDGKVETDNGAIGDVIPYVITSSVPDMRGYKKYFFVVNDTLSKGLTFNNDVKVTIGGTDVTQQIAVTSATAESGETAIEIVFKNFIQYAGQPGDDIVITYSATINDQAVIGNAGNPNKAHLIYSNNPNKDAQGDPENPDKPGPDNKDVIGETPDAVTKTFVTRLEVLKTNGEGKPLAGAKFKLEGDRLNTVLITSEVYTQSEQGTYYLLKDGSYTTAEPIDATKDQYQSISQKYVKNTETTTVTKTEHVVYEGFTDNQGHLTFSGLAAGNYILTELVAPNGYNMLKDPIKITITCKLPGDANGNAEWTVTDPATAADGIIKLTVKNTSGTELPETGGIGTTIFYVVGAALMIAAVVLFITKKRMSSEA